MLLCSGCRDGTCDGLVDRHSEWWIQSFQTLMCVRIHSKHKSMFVFVYMKICKHMYICICTKTIQAKKGDFNPWGLCRGNSGLCWVSGGGEERMNQTVILSAGGEPKHRATMRPLPTLDPLGRPIIPHPTTFVDSFQPPSFCLLSGLEEKRYRTRKVLHGDLGKECPDQIPTALPVALAGEAARFLVLEGEGQGREQKEGAGGSQNSSHTNTQVPDLAWSRVKVLVS